MRVLEEVEVLAIRRLLGRNVRQGEIADAFGVHQSTISQIATRKNWGWLP